MRMYFTLLAHTLEAGKIWQSLCCMGFATINEPLHALSLQYCTLEGQWLTLLLVFFSGFSPFSKSKAGEDRQPPALSLEPSTQALPYPHPSPGK